MTDDEKANALRDWAGLKARVAEKSKREADVKAKAERRRREVLGIKDREDKLLGVANTDPERFQREGYDKEVAQLRRQRGAS